MDIPEEVKNIIDALENAGHKAYAVGGCVRDLLIGATHGERVEPKDWDVATSATPEEVQKIFPDSFYENAFGTVGVKAQTAADNGQHESALSPRKSATIVEVTTFRVEEVYSDKRHPDAVTFTKTVEEDLARRDFTMNAIALSFSRKRESRPHPALPLPRGGTEGWIPGQARNDMEGIEVIDPYGGWEDIKNKLIRAVGNAEKRFAEDALRMMRAVRFASELGFTIEPETLEAIKKNSAWLRRISQERIRDELEKLLMADDAVSGVRLLEEAGLLQYVLPELREGIGVEQNLHHIYTVFEHNVRALAYAVKKKYDFAVRLASLLHDVGKPRSKRGEGRNSTFYGHDVIGAHVAEGLMKRLRFPREVIEKVTLLVRYHLFYYNVGEVTESSVRRLLKNVGPENIDDLVKVREADRIGSGVPKAVPYKLRHFQFMVEKVSKDPISTSMLAVDGNDVMRILNIPPGPKVGLVLNALLGEVLEDPGKNTREYLEKRTIEFGEQSAEDLKKYLETKEKKIQEEEDAMKKKYYV